jgi:hypothetical protein
MSLLSHILLIGLAVLSTTRADGTVIHLPLYRRGGRFAGHEAANLSYMDEVLRGVEASFAQTSRKVESNRLVRKWQNSYGENDPNVFDVAGHGNRW